MAQGVLARLRFVTDAGLNLLFPPTCVGCGRLGDSFCPHCAQAVEAIPHPQCARCGTPQPTATPLCVNCKRNSRQFGGHLPLLTRAAALHTTPMREAIHAFKYENQPQLAAPLARYLVAIYDQPPWTTLPHPITAVVPVPLHEQRLHERGYNQSALLATHFCHAIGLPLQPAWLARSRQTRQQVGLGPTERQANVQDAFTAPGDVAGHSLLLIDDVYTTGATLRACAVAALAAGAKTVYGLTLARPRNLAPATLQEPPDAVSGKNDLPWWEAEL